jgi:hypothetical protein
MTCVLLEVRAAKVPAYMTILLLYNYHTAIIRWIPLTVQILTFKKALNSLL